MIKPRIKILSFLNLLLISVIIFLSGCSNILIADNQVLDIDLDVQKVATINSINNIQPGKVCTVTDNSQLLSITKQESNLYSIDLYDPNNSTLVSLITSESRIYDVKAAKDGFFYTKLSLNDPTSVQINWSSFDKTKERTITNPEDSVDGTIYALDGDKVIFINNGNELIFSDSLGVRDTYNLSFPVEVRKIIWSSDPKIGYIIATDSESDNYNLYEIELGDNHSASTTTIAKNVLDMDLDENNDLIYLNQNSRNTIVYEISNPESHNSQPLFSDLNIEKITFDKDSNGIIYTVQSETGIRSTIWFYNRENDEKIQMTSPARIISSLFSIKSNQLIYSISQQTYIENNEIIESNNYIANLIYTLK